MRIHGIFEFERWSVTGFERNLSPTSRYRSPESFQGRVGALADFSHKIPNLHLLAYLPASGSNAFKHRCDTAIFTWLQQIVDEHSPKTHLFLYTDANAKIGWQNTDTGRVIRQDPMIVGALAKEISNTNGLQLVHFCRRNHIALINTFVGGHPTFFSWRNTASMIDFLGCSASELPAVSMCETWKATGYRLQLCRQPCLRDHVPVVANFDFNNSYTATRTPIHWDLDRLLHPELFKDDAQRFLLSFDNWVESNNIEQQLQELGDQRRIDDAWNIISSGVSQSAEVYHRPRQTFKFPPSTETRQLRDKVALCREQRRHFFLKLDFKQNYDATLSSLLWSWLWTARQNKYDKRLATTRRNDRIWWRDFWNSQLYEALQRRQYRRAWYLARKIAGTGSIKHWRFYSDVSANTPRLHAWISSVCSSGPSGGLQAKLLSTETFANSSVMPFDDSLRTWALNMPVDIFLSTGGGRGKFSNVDSSVPIQFLRERRLQCAEQNWIYHADMDLQRLKKGLRKGKTGKAVPVWSLPLEIWRLLIIGKSGCMPALHAERVLWLLFRCLRLSAQCPAKWNVSYGFGIPKWNGKPGCAGYRLLHLLDPFGKAWSGELALQSESKPFDWTFAFRPHRRREQPIAQQRILQHRFTAAGFSWCFSKWDTTNAFGSISKPALQATIHEKGLDFDDEILLNDRLWRSFIIIESPEQQRALFLEGSGCRQGDVGSPRLFDDSHARKLSSWHDDQYKYSCLLEVPAPVLEDMYFDRLTYLGIMVFADDTARSGSFTSIANLQNQLQRWDSTLDTAIAEINLQQNPSKKQNLVSFVSSTLGDAFQRQILDKSKSTTELTYLGSIIQYKGDLSSEITERIDCARRAWFLMRRFWSQAAIAEKFRRAVFLALVRSCLLTGLEAMVTTQTQYSQLESEQCKYLRKLLCGKGCLKIHRVNSRNEHFIEFRSLTNQHIRETLRITSIESELIFRRLRWLQQSVRYENDSVNYLAAWQGQALWETTPTILPNGELGPNANPWTRQAFSDLHCLSACEKGQFAEQWSLHKWWAIDSAAFQTVRLAVVKSSLIPSPKLFSFTQSDVMCRNVCTCSFLPQKLRLCQHCQGFPPSMNPDSWMELPSVPHHDPGEERGKPVAKFKSGKGRPGASSSSNQSPSGECLGHDRLADKALLNLDARLRAQEDITEDAVDVPSSLPDIVISLKVGPNYNAYTQANRGKKTGSVHAFLWAALVKSMSQLPECPAEFRQILSAYCAQKLTPAQIKRQVPYCTLHRHHNDNTRATLAVHVRSELASIWNAMRQFYFQRGAKEFEDTIPRGPIFRQILRRISSA
eukprot:TRINITY_DN9766_c1_g1_i2.p1 TRINITY_DN9766_c1_g1~~TRINITY_DN9766_c1_g1_i2.p1  ORF type:complete len:1323 (-),score=80.85 TRINITY_DN9766_c1_g1_i2:275-4243(-)